MRLTYNDSASYTSLNNAWCVAATGDTVHVVWYDRRDGNFEIYTKRSSDGGVSWGPDIRLTNNSTDSYDPSVTASGSNVHVVWRDNRDGNFEIYTKRSSDGGVSWGLDTRLTNDNASSIFPSVGASGSNIHVVWEDDRDGNIEIYAKRSSDGGVSWGTDTRLTNDPAGSWNPSVAASGSNVHVIWWDSRDGIEIYAKRSSDGGVSWGTDTRLTNDPAGSGSPSVAASGSNVQVVWEGYRDGNAEIYTKRSSDGGVSWGTDSRLTNDPAWSRIPSAAASGSNVHVVWDNDRDGNFEIYTKRSSDWGLTWGPDTRLTNDPAWSWNPSVAASGSNVHVVWYDYRDGNEEVYYKRNPTGNTAVELPGRFQPLTSNLSFSVVPNPFTSFARVPGHSSERFALFDISGRKVGVYKGDRIGEGLSAGVYFLRSESKDTKPLRIVKVR